MDMGGGVDTASNGNEYQELSNYPAGQRRPAHKTDLTAISEPIV
jgi:hypothetical protein